MMVMVGEHIDDEMVAIPQSDRRWLYEHGVPPSRWRIWIGQHRRETHELFLHNVAAIGTGEEIAQLPTNAEAPPNTQTTTICLGDYLVIHVMSSNRVRSFLRRWKLPSEIAGAMKQIWPIQDGLVTWPAAAVALTDDGLARLSMHFFDEMRLSAQSVGKSS